MDELRDDGRRFEMEEAGFTAYADYRRSEGRLFIDYVFAPPQLRGSGAAGRLMSAISARARADGLSITPICGYAAAWLRRSPEFRDLLG